MDSCSQTKSPRSQIATVTATPDPALTRLSSVLAMAAASLGKDAGAGQCPNHLHCHLPQRLLPRRASRRRAAGHPWRDQQPAAPAQRPPGQQQCHELQ